mgnify:CR=1 FL=1
MSISFSVFLYHSITSGSIDFTERATVGALFSMLRNSSGGSVCQKLYQKCGPARQRVKYKFKVLVEGEKGDKLRLASDELRGAR